MSDENWEQTLKRMRDGDKQRLSEAVDLFNEYFDTEIDIDTIYQGTVSIELDDYENSLKLIHKPDYDALDIYHSKDGWQCANIEIEYKTWKGFIYKDYSGNYIPNNNSIVSPEVAIKTFHAMVNLGEFYLFNDKESMFDN